MNDVDTRLRQMKAAVDEVRTLAADIQEQTDCEPLTDLRHYLLWALCAIERAGAVLDLKAAEAQRRTLRSVQ